MVCGHEQACKKIRPLPRCGILRVSGQTWFCGVGPMWPIDLEGQSSVPVVQLALLAVSLVTSGLAREVSDHGLGCTVGFRVLWSHLSGPGTLEQALSSFEGFCSRGCLFLWVLPLHSTCAGGQMCWNTTLPPKVFVVAV